MESESVSVLRDPGKVPPGKTRVIFWNRGPDFAKSSIRSWTLGDFTGFYPGSSGSEPAVGADDLRPSTAVQIHCKTIAMLLDSRSVPNLKPPTLIPTAIHYEFSPTAAPFPFVKPGGRVVYSLELQVPTVSTSGKAAAYLMAYLLFRDAGPSGKSFWYGASLFDSRGKALARETVTRDEWEHGTGIPIVSGASALAARFFTARNQLPKGWRGFRPFELMIGPQEFREALVALRARFADFSTIDGDPAHWRLSAVVVNPELFIGNVESSASLGFSIRNLQVAEERGD